jgi:addiction module RelE/StbE family toxin
MQVEWSKNALADFDDIATYLSRENPTAAARFSGQMFNDVERLALFPAMGREGRIIGTREWVSKSGSYVIPYRVRHGKLQVLAIFHTRRASPSKG